MKFEYIEWIDSYSEENTWEFREDIKPIYPILCRSVGFLEEENDDYVVLAHSITDKQVCGRMSIPKVCIKRRRSYGRMTAKKAIMTAKKAITK